MTKGLRTVRVRCLTLVVGLGLSALGCGSAARLEELQLQLSSVQQQLSELQAEAAAKSDVEQLADSLELEAERSAIAESAVKSALGRLEVELSQVAEHLDDRQYEAAEIQRGLADTRAEVQGLRIQVAELARQTAAPGPKILSSDPEELYRAASADFESGKYDLALLGFRQYVENFGSSDQADDALYWIGECYLSQQKYRQAIQEFNRVATLYPNSNRLATALLRKGFGYLALGETDQGRLALQGVVDTYPSSDEAILARAQLESLLG